MIAAHTLWFCYLTADISLASHLLSTNTRTSMGGFCSTTLTLIDWSIDWSILNDCFTDRESAVPAAGVAPTLVGHDLLLVLRTRRRRRCWTRPPSSDDGLRCCCCWRCCCISTASLTPTDPPAPLDATESVSGQDSCVCGLTLSRATTGCPGRGEWRAQRCRSSGVVQVSTVRWRVVTADCRLGETLTASGTTTSTGSATSLSLDIFHDLTKYSRHASR